MIRLTLSALLLSVLAACATKPTANDADMAPSTRQGLTEQSDGVNRGDTEPYRAESAGKAYRAYVESIGKPNESGASQSSPLQAK